MPSLQARVARVMARMWRPAGPVNVQTQRRAWESYAAFQWPPPGTTLAPAKVGSVPAEWVKPADAVLGRRLLYLHGGGYISGSHVTHRAFVGHLAKTLAAWALVPDYRLAPEHPFPAALDDVREVYDWLAAEAVSEIVVAGDSAGGGLALSLVEALRDDKARLPDAVVCFSPMTDLSLSGPSIRALAPRDPTLTPEYARWSAHQYAGNHPTNDPKISPLFGDLRGLPPMLLEVGGDEILLDDARRFAERAQAAGDRVKLHIWQGLFHGFQEATFLPESKEVLDEVKGFVGTLRAERHSAA